MVSPRARNSVLAVAVALLFTATVVVLLQVIPPPRRDTDYLVIGGVATFVALLAVFVALISTVFRSSDLFSRKRKQ
jgi:hypothetical protein